MFIVLEFQSFRVNLVLSRWIILKEVLSRWMKPRWSSALPFEHELSISEYGPLNQPSQLYLLKYGDFWERPEPATSLPQSFAELKQHKFEWALLWLCRPTNQPNNWQPTTKQSNLSAKQKMLSQLAPFQTTNDPPDHLLSSLEALKFFLL